MITIVSRIFRYGLKNFWRNGWLSAATVAIMVLALVVIVGLNLFRVITDRATASIQDKIDISVYFKTSAPEDQILNIKSSIENFAEVKSVDYISTDRALEVFREEHQDDQVITEALGELSSNPLQASLNIKANKPDQYAQISEYFLNNDAFKDYIESVSYSKNQVVIDRLGAIIANANRVGLALTVFLTLVAGLVVFNTIRLAIYSNREEIGVMRVVGASNSLVRGPYMIEGMVDGAIAAVLSLLLAAPFVYLASPYLNVFIPGLNIFQYFYSNLVTLFLAQLAFGVVIGGVSSVVAVRRYLRN